MLRMAHDIRNRFKSEIGMIDQNLPAVRTYEMTEEWGQGNTADHASSDWFCSGGTTYS